MSCEPTSVPGEPPLQTPCFWEREQPSLLELQHGSRTSNRGDARNVTISADEVRLPPLQRSKSDSRNPEVALLVRDTVSPRRQVAVMISLEGIFGVDGKSFGGQREEEVDVFLRFRSSPADFEVHGVSIDMLESEKLESFLVKSLQPFHHGDAHNTTVPSNLARHILVPFVTYFRARQFPHTATSQLARQWDTRFTETLLSAVLASNADMSWKRVCRQLMLSDFTTTPTFDGSGGIIAATMESINNLVDAVCIGDLDIMTTVLSEAEKLSAWFLPRYVTSRPMNGWTLLHFAAASPAMSAEFYTYLVRRVGCSVTAGDLTGQNALHVAASCLNSTALAVFTATPIGAVRATDRNGNTPLHALLQTASLCNWRRRLSSDKFQSMITALFPAGDLQLLWRRTYQPERGALDLQLNQAQRTVSLQSALLFPAIVYTDDFIAEHVLRLARAAPRDTTSDRDRDRHHDWDRDLLAHIAIRCVRSPADRTATVELLLRDFDLVGAAPMLGTNPLAVLDTLLCHAVACAARRANGGRPQITALLSRVVEQLPPDGTDAAQAVAPLAFLYLAVAKQDAALLGDILSLLPRSAVHSLVFPPSPSPTSELEFDAAFQKRMATFLDESTASEMEVPLERLPRLSPLSLACALGGVEVVNVLLRAAYFARPRRHAPGSSVGDEVSVQSEYFAAVLQCVLHGRFDCLRTIRNLCTKEAMFQLCFLETDMVSGRTVFVALLDAIRTILQKSSSFCRGRTGNNGIICNSEAPQRHGTVADMKAYADCLKLLLETLPPTSDATLLDMLRNSYARMATPNERREEQPFAGEEVAERVQSQLDTATEGMRGLCGKSDTHDAYFTALKTQRAVAEKVIAATPELKAISEQWARFCCERTSLQQQMRSESFKTALRVMARKNTPDKKWVKLAFCTNRLLRVLQVRLPLSSVGDSDLGGLPSAIDASGWTAFVSALSKVCKSRDHLDGFVDSLAAALDVVGSDRLAQEEVVAVTTVVETLMADNQLAVMMRNGQSPLNVANDDGVPHYQVNDIRPDHHNHALFDLMSNWLSAIVLAVQLRGQLQATPAPDLPSGPVGQGVSLLEYVSFCALLEEEHHFLRLQTILDTSRAGVLRSPLQRLLHGLRTPSSGDECSSCDSGVDCLLRALRQAGASPLSECDVADSEKRKARNAKHLEQVACVLAEFHERLGGNAEDLARCLFPLCALQMWKAADVVLALCRKSSSTQARAQANYGLSAVAHVSAHSSEDLLQCLCASLVAGSSDFATVNPLHFAVLHGQTHFVTAYLQVFPCTPAELLELVQFALRVRAFDMVAILVAHSSSTGAGSRSQLTDRQAILGYCPSPTLGEAGQRHQAQHLSIRGCYRLRSRALVCANIFISALAEAQAQSWRHKNVEVAHEPEEMFVVRRDPASQRRLVLLQDGKEAEYDAVMNDADLLARALPAPTPVAGLLGTGHTVLHEACRGGHLDLVQELMSVNPEWRSRVLSVDRNGETPLSIAVSGGNFDVAHHLLTAIATESQGTASTDRRSLEDLYRAHTAADSSARTRLCGSIVTDAERKLRALQQDLDVPQVPGAATRRVLRGYQVDSVTHVLTRHLQHMEQLWRRLRSADPQTLLHVAHLPACGQLDSVIRARQALVLLGIPLSQLAPPLKQVGRSVLPAGRTAAAMKDFVDLSPQKLRKLVTYPSALQLKSLLNGWYRLRSASPPSALDDTLFLFRNVDVSLQEQGRAGVEASLFLRQQAAYVRACDRVRARGVPTLDPANSMGSLAHQLCQEMRFDVTSSSRENMLRHANLSGLGAADGTAKLQTQSLQTSKVLSLLRTMQVDAATCAQVLHLAYLVLDFCRSVCIARLLVAATGQPQSTGSSEHPLDQLQGRVLAARKNLARLKSVLSSDLAAPAGVLSKLPICDTLDEERLSGFFHLPAEFSVKFHTTRGFVLEALSSLLQDHEQFPLSEFVCRIAVSSSERGTGGGTGNIDEQTDQTEASAPKDAHTKGARITDDAEGLQRLLRFLHRLTVQDLVYCAGRGALEQFAARNADRVSELSNPDCSFLRLQPDEVTIVAERDNSCVQRPMLSLLASKDTDRAADKAKAEAEARLRDAYDTASALCRLVAAAVFLPSQRRLYETDAAMAVQGGRRVDPLSIVCAAGSAWCQLGDSNLESVLPTRRCAAAVRRSQRFTCDLLLQLGADPCAANEQSVAPLEVAALSGDVELLQACLGRCDSERLQSLTRYDTLVWHTLVASAGGMAGVRRSSVGPDYAGCVQLLLEHNFPTAAPARCDYSALEVALITQAPSPVLAALVVRRIVMSLASAQRAMQWLLLRDESAPVEVAEALLYGHNKSAGGEGWLGAQPDVLGDLCGSAFHEHVTAGSATLLHHVAQLCGKARSVPSVDAIVTRLRLSIAARIDALAQQWRRRNHHSSTVIVRGLRKCSAALQAGSPSEPIVNSTGRTTLLWALAASFQQYVVDVVVQTLKDALVKQIRVDDDGSVVIGDAGNGSLDEVKLGDLICRACHFDNVAILTALERLYEKWVPPAPEDEAEGKMTDAGDPNLAKDRQQHTSSWSDLLNRVGYCPELEAHLSPLDCALEGRASRCVAYLCGQTGTQVSCQQALAAIAKYHLPEDTALLVLQRATSGSTQQFTALDGYGSNAEFLSATEHGDLLSGESLLHLCCRRGYARLARHLLSLGADVMQEDCSGCSALVCSIAAGHGEVTRALYPHCPERVKRAVDTLTYVARKALLRRWRTMR